MSRENNLIHVFNTVIKMYYALAQCDVDAKCIIIIHVFAL